MDNTGAFTTINNYSEYLKVSSSTTRIGELRKMTLIPFLKDVIGGKLTQYVTPKDRQIWNKFLKCCYPSLQTLGKSGGVATIGYAYVGTGNIAPTKDIILNESTTYLLPEYSTLVSPRVTGKFLWIAIPYGYTIDEIINTSFSGDWVPLEGLSKSSISLDDGTYNLYVMEGKIPFYNIYQIKIK